MDSFGPPPLTLGSSIALGASLRGRKATVRSLKSFRSLDNTLVTRRREHSRDGVVGSETEKQQLVVKEAVEKADFTKKVTDRYHVLLLCCPVLAVCVGYFMYNVLHSGEVQYYDREAEGCVVAVTESIKQMYLLSLKDVVATLGLLATTATMEHDFLQFTKQLFSNSDQGQFLFQFIAWAPVVPHHLRASYESSMQPAHPGFHFTEYNTNDTTYTPRATSLVYYPLYYVYPPEQLSLIHGFDLGSEPSSLDAMNVSASSCVPVVSSRVVLLNGYGCRVLLPLHKDEEVVGYCTGVLLLSEMLRYAVLGIDKNIRLHLYDLSDNGEMLHSDTGTTERGDLPSNAIKRVLHVGGRTWEVAVELRDEKYSDIPVIMGFIAAAVSVVCLFAAVLLHRGTHLSKLRCQQSLKVARACAEAIAVLDLESVMWLLELPAKSDEHLISLGTIVSMIVEYKRFLPQPTGDATEKGDTMSCGPGAPVMLSLPDEGHTHTDPPPLLSPIDESKNPSLFSSLTPSACRLHEELQPTENCTLLTMRLPQGADVELFASVVFSGLAQLGKVVDFSCVQVSILVLGKSSAADIYDSWSRLAQCGLVVPTSAVYGPAETGVFGGSRRFVIMGSLVEKSHALVVYCAQAGLEFVCDLGFKSRLLEGDPVAIALCFSSGIPSTQFFEIWRLQPNSARIAAKCLTDVSDHIEGMDLASAAAALPSTAFVAHETAIARTYARLMRKSRGFLQPKVSFGYHNLGEVPHDKGITSHLFSDRVAVNGDLSSSHDFSFAKSYIKSMRVETPSARGQAKTGIPQLTVTTH